MLIIILFNFCLYILFQQQSKNQVKLSNSQDALCHGQVKGQKNTLIKLCEISDYRKKVQYLVSFGSRGINLMIYISFFVPNVTLID